MAVTATITTSPTGVVSGQPFDLALVVSNGGASSVTVADIQQVITPNGSSSQAISVAKSLSPTWAGQNVTVGAGGSTTFNLKAVIYEGCTQGAVSTLYDYFQCGANVTINDAGTLSVISPTAAVVGVLSSPRNSNAGLLWFNQFEDSGLAALV